MSRVGNKVIVVENGVEVSVVGSVVTVKGPKGELACDFDASAVSFKIEGGSISVARSSDIKSVKSKHGLYRALVANMIEGVSKGYEKSMFLQGIGYRVQLKGSDLEFSLGYSHPVLFKAPDGVKFHVEGQDKFKVSGIDKQAVGEACAQIKKLRKRDAYKGKGIHFVGDVIRKKPGKSIKK